MWSLSKWHFIFGQGSKSQWIYIVIVSIYYLIGRFRQNPYKNEKIDNNSLGTTKFKYSRKTVIYVHGWSMNGKDDATVILFRDGKNEKYVLNRWAFYILIFFLQYSFPIKIAISLLSIGRNLQINGILQQ